MNAAEKIMIDHLVNIEAHVHYGEPPPPEVQPFVVVARNSPILISAPHGARTFRNSADEAWHEEDEYTAAMALVLGERCGVSVIANVWKSDKCDPNYHVEDQCAYKRQIRTISEKQGVRWLIDLHGAAKDTDRMKANELVDLGTLKEADSSLEVKHRNKLRELITSNIKSEISIGAFPGIKNSTVTRFCHEELKHVAAVQIEMKPQVRVPFRRVDASSYAKFGPYSAPPETVIAMLKALEDFINYLKGLPES